MECENHFCIDCKEHRCRLDTISLDIRRNCQDCIYVSLSEKDLQQAKEKLLNRYEEEYMRWK